MSDRKPWRAPRACVRCGWIRVVIISEVTEGKPTSEIGVNGQPVYEFTVVGESFNKHCKACAYELNARKYTRLASENQRRADEIRLARKLKNG